MTWIRNPSWDAAWILSGVPIGIGLAVWRPPIMIVVGIFAAINVPHLISPIVLAWTHCTFRRVALARWKRFIATPIIVTLIGIAVGFSAVGPIQVNAVTLEIRVADYRHDFPLLAWIGLYFVWNAYHFGAQNFGILRLYGIKDRKVVIKRLTISILKLACVAFTVLGFIIIPHVVVKGFMPADSFLRSFVPIFSLEAFSFNPLPTGSFLRSYVPIFILGLFSFNHSLAAIGLSSSVWSNHHRISPWFFVVTVFAASAPLAWLLAHSTTIISSLLLSPSLAGRLVAAGVDRDARERSSDSRPRLGRTCGCKRITLLAGLWEAQTEQRVVEARHKSDPKGDKGQAIMKAILAGLALGVSLCDALLVMRAQADDAPPDWACAVNPPDFKVQPDDGTPRHVPDSTAAFTVC